MTGHGDDILDLDAIKRDLAIVVIHPDGTRIQGRGATPDDTERLVAEVEWLRGLAAKTASAYAEAGARLTRERQETDAYLERQEATRQAVMTRAKKAEAERDAARADATALRDGIDEWLLAWTRPDDDCDAARARLDALLAAPSPGAARCAALAAADALSEADDRLEDASSDAEIEERRDVRDAARDAYRKARKVAR